MLIWQKLKCEERPNERPVISFGHDKCIFCQFIFTSSAWKGTKGEQATIPKDEPRAWIRHGTYLRPATENKCLLE
jgi:hypothetical protein